jgi:hypothetical protein
VPTDYEIVKAMLARAGVSFLEYGHRAEDDRSVEAAAPDKCHVAVVFRFRPDGGLIDVTAADPSMGAFSE